MAGVNYNYFKTDNFIFRGDPGFFLKASVMDPQNVTVPHSHEFTECVFITGGHGLHQCARNPEVPISRGDILIIPPKGVHAYTSASDDLVLINFLFDTDHLPPVLLELYAKDSYKKLFLKGSSPCEGADFPFFHPEAARFEEMEFYARKLVECSRTPGNHCRKLGLFMVLLSLLTDAAGPVSGEGSGFPVLDIPKLTAYMKNNFQRPVYLEELSRLASVSNATLMRHFRASFGCTPMEYLRRLRLRHAAELLLNSSLSVKEISDMSGFAAQAYFFRAFRRSYGVSPAEFRKVREKSL
ncbi:MAG: helix-turn-helix domain-containing protein [Lentisphaeria bacterium]|nr:helix-turn-helix domain-containing protein [Lentisphaeria bacterium]